MTRTNARLLSFVACLLAATSLLAQTEFSADAVNIDKDGKSTHTSKMIFGKDKLRIEGGDPSARGNGIVLINLTTHISTVLMPQQHMYMEVPAQGKEMQQTFSLFRIGDVANACEEWLKIEPNKGGTCRRVGNETVNGRNTVKYETTNAKGETTQVWIDPKLSFPVKWHGSHEQGGELRNIQEGAQPASLFEIPAGYTKMDMGSMMQQHAPK